MYRKPRFNQFFGKQIDFQRPAFQDLNNFCTKHLYEKLLSQFRALHSYRTRNTRTGKQNCLRLLLHINFILAGLAILFSYCSVTCSHFSIRYVEVYFTFAFLECVRCNEDFVKSRFCSIHFIVILAWLKKIFRYTEDVDIKRIVKVFRYSFSEAMQLFFNRLKSGFSLSDRCKIFTSNWLWMEICENEVLRKIDITMTTINKTL